MPIESLARERFSAARVTAFGAITPSAHRGVRRRALGLLCAVAFSPLSGVAAADDQAANAAPASSAQAAGADAATVGEIVVTARHRRENAQNVPISLSAIGGAFLEKTNTTNISQLSQFVPSVQFTFFNARNANLNIRGLGDNVGLASDGIEPGVGFYVDQVYYDRPATTTFDLIDLDQVEVLRGPQGTLFGKNTTAGAITLTTATPAFVPQATVEVSGGNYGYLQIKGSATGPIVDDRLAGRLSVAATTRQGLLTDTYGSGPDFSGGDRKVDAYQNLTLRGQLLYAPSNDFKLRLIADYGKQDTNCCAEVLAGIVSPPNGKSFVSYAQAFGYTPQANPFDRETDTNSPIYARQETGGISAQADWTLPKAVLTSVTAWRFWNWWPANDADYSPLTVLAKAQNGDYQNQFSQEIRIASTGVNLIDYVGGLYLFHEQIDALGEDLYGDAASYFLLGPAAPAAVANGFDQVYTADYRTTSLAAFGQGTWHVTSKWSLTGGLRYTYDEKRGGFNQTVSGGAPLSGSLAAYAPYRNALAVADAFSVNYDSGDLAGQASISYQATSNLLAYLDYGRGYKSGGLNLTQLPAGASEVIQPESIDDVEAGVKSRLFDRGLTLNGDVFWEQDENYQANLVVPGTVHQYLSNVPLVRSEGVEFDLRAQPTDDLSLYASGTYDDGVYASYPSAPCPLETITAPSCNLSGRPLAGVSRWVAAAGGEYSRPLALGPRQVEAYAGLDYSFRSSVYSASTDSIYSLLPDLSLVSARLGLRAGDGRWDAFLWGKNIFNAQYFTFVSAGVGNTGALYAQLGDPQTYGLTVRLHY